jgi:putative membrane protein
MSRLIAAAVLAAGLAASSAALAKSEPPHKFLEDALKGDNSEMTLGQMAAERAHDPAVRDYGRTLHDDHAKAKADALTVARRMGVADTREMMPEAKAEQRKLSRLRGAAFDREFVRYMRHDHEKDVAEFKAESARPGEVGQLAERTLPDLQKHLDIARRLSR